MDLAAIKLKRQRRKAYFFETFAELLRTHSQILLLDGIFFFLVPLPPPSAMMMPVSLSACPVTTPPGCVGFP